MFALSKREFNFNIKFFKRDTVSRIGNSTTVGGI